MWYRFMLLGALLTVHCAARAEGHAVAAKAGLLGLGAEYAYALNERIGLRAGFNGSDFGFDGEESGISYDFDLIWDSLSLGVDFHPRSGPFRVSAGVLSNDNGMRATSRISGNTVVGGTTYTPAEVGTLRAGVFFKSTAPYVGIGWDWSRSKRRFGVSFDMGLLSQGSPRVALSADGSLISDAAFLADLEDERIELESGLDSLDLVPYGTLGLVFKF